MNRFLQILLAFGLLAACGSTPVGLKTNDVIQIRPLITEDPLAVKVTDDEGVTHYLGDVILDERGVHRVSVEEFSPQEDILTYDFLLTLEDRDWAKLKDFWGINEAKTVVVFLQGKMHGMIDGTSFNQEKGRLRISGIASTEEEAEKLANVLANAARSRKPGSSAK